MVQYAIARTGRKSKHIFRLLTLPVCCRAGMQKDSIVSLLGTCLQCAAGYQRQGESSSMNILEGFASLLTYLARGNPFGSFKPSQRPLSAVATGCRAYHAMVTNTSEI